MYVWTSLAPKKYENGYPFKGADVKDNTCIVVGIYE